jgi:hypothetical protein
MLMLRKYAGSIFNGRLHNLSCILSLDLESMAMGWSGNDEVSQCRRQMFLQQEDGIKCTSP